MPSPKYSRYYTFIKPVIEHRFVRSFAPYIFSLLTVIIMMVFAIKPTISTILNLQKDLENNQKVLESIKSKTASLTASKQTLDSLDPLVRDKISVAVPQNPNITSLIGSLQNSSIKQASVSALQIQPLTVVNNQISTLIPKKELGEVNFSYNIQGSFSQLLASLYNLSRSPRLISLDSVVISKLPDGQTIVSITGKGFYLK